MLDESKVAARWSAAKSCLDRTIIVQSVAAQGRLRSGLSKGRHRGFSCSHHENMKRGSFQKNGGGEATKEDEVMRSC